ncbi:MAG TPA: cellulose synthase operon protein YhjQ/BcsQ [Stellaceae bacterium]|nr:cellulose synthase operon protein YhjQ/BcsQ [Stellaceae bacterium]
MFVPRNGAKESIEQVLTDRRLTKARARFFDGAIDDATQQYEGSPSPDLLIIETHDDTSAIFAKLDGLSRVCRRETQLILIGRHNDVGLYRALTKQGVHEYLPLPPDPHHLLDAVVAICTDPDERKLGRLVSFIGASGGAGSTTIANNVAWCLGKLYDAEATLIDLDLAFGTVAIDFNLESPENSQQALAQSDRLDDQLLARIIGKYNENLGLLTAPGDCARAADVVPAALESTLTRLRRNASWVVADLPHCWGAWVRQVLDTSDEVVVTAVPTLASLRNAKSILDALNPQRKNDAPVRVVLNHVGANPKTDIASKEFAAALGSALSVTVPHEPALFGEAANTGHMVGEAPRAKGVIDPLNALARLVSGRSDASPHSRVRKHGLWHKLRPAAGARMADRAKA